MMPLDAFRFAACTELFYPLFNDRLQTQRSFAQVARLLRRAGYTAIEIAPATLNTQVLTVTDAELRNCLRQAGDEEMEIAGLHWLGAKVEDVDIHLTAGEPARCQAMADYLVRLGEMCQVLGGQVMTFGSPGQRNLPDGTSVDEGLKRAADVFRSAVERLEGSGVKIAVEGLGPDETNFLTSMDEVLRLVGLVDHPGLGYMLDVKALFAQTNGSGPEVLELIRRHGNCALHFHANDANRMRPGAGDVDFVQIFRALKQSGFRGMVSVEVFKLGGLQPSTVYKEALAYMRACAPVMETRGLPRQMG